MTVSSLSVAPSSTLHYSRDESSTAQALSGTNVQRAGTYSRTHSRAPSQKSAFTAPRLGYGGQSESATDDDDSSEGGAYGLRGSHSGLMDGQDDLGDLENEEGQHFWVNTRHLTSGNPAALTEEEQSGKCIAILWLSCLWMSAHLYIPSQLLLGDSDHD